MKNQTLNRSQFILFFVLIFFVFFRFKMALEHFQPNYDLILYPFFFWIVLKISIKRMHNINKRALWLLIAFIPVLGPIALFYWLFCQKTIYKQNPYFGIIAQDRKYLVVQ